MRDDMILCEVFDALFHPDEYVRTRRKWHPIAWVLGMLMWTVVGLTQFLLWLLTIIPALINKWVRDWRYI